MKKIFKIFIFCLMMFSFSFAEDIKTIDGIQYISEDVISNMYNTNVKLYANSNLVELKINEVNYYFRVGTDKVKKDVYINPFFINDSKLRFETDNCIQGNVVLEDGKVYMPLSFFHNELYEKNCFDVIVMGGDPEGITAAISAARNGGKVLLLSEEDGLGGLFTFGMLNTLDMNYSNSGELLTKGIFEEFFNKINRKDSFDVEEVKRVFDEMVNGEKNIDYRKNYKFTEAILEDNKIIGIKATNLDGTLESFYARRIIDATQDGDVCAAAGVPYTVGMEDVNSNEIMCVTLCFKVGGVDWEVLKQDIERYMKETGDTGCGINNESAWGFGKWCYDKYTAKFDNMRLRGPNFGRQNDGTVLINALQIFDVNVEDENSVKDAISNGTWEAYNIVDYLKTKLNSFQNAYLAGVADELYVRETRHIQGEYILKASDLLNNRNFDDKIAMGSYPVDIQSTSKNNYGYVILSPDQYSIPYRCTVPLNIDNLYIVGKAASYSSVAAGSARVVPIGMVEGESIGAISMYSIRNNVIPREIIGNFEMNEEINKLLVNQGVYLPEYTSNGPFEGIKNRDKLEKLVDLGLISGGYNNDFKLNNNATNETAIKYLSNTIKSIGIEVDKDTLSKIQNFYSKDELNLVTMSKILTILFGEYDEEYTDFEVFINANSRGYFKSLEGKYMYDVMTSEELYAVIIDAIDMLQNNL